MLVSFSDFIAKSKGLRKLSEMKFNEDTYIKQFRDMLRRFYKFIDNRNIRIRDRYITLLFLHQSTGNYLSFFNILTFGRY